VTPASAGGVTSAGAGGVTCVGAGGVGAAWAASRVDFRQGRYGTAHWYDRWLVVSRYAVGRLRPGQRVRQVGRDQRAQPWAACLAMPVDANACRRGCPRAGRLWSWPRGSGARSAGRSAPDRVGVQQHAEQGFGVVGGVAVAVVAVGSVEGAPSRAGRPRRSRTGEVAFGEPVAHVGGEQEGLVAVAAQEVVTIAHPTCSRL
jgi:hypothetical protein